eukprot:jgi/Psemu1/202442/e_gw1.299.6.1
MTSTLDSTKPRLTPRQREAAERRSRMTQRRQELTSRIRKQKKSQYLQNKRGLPCGDTVNSASDANSDMVTTEFKSMLESYCANPVPPEQLLPTLENIIARINSSTSTASLRNAENPLVVLESRYENAALRFLDCLRQQAVEAIANENVLSFRSILRILVHLTSISSGDRFGSSTTTSMDYYGRHPSTWSQLVVSTSSQTTAAIPDSVPTSPSWLGILVQSLSSVKEVELTSLLLGNLVGDDNAAQTVFRAISNDFKSSMVAGLIRSVSPTTPTAAWTLTNMIRNDSFSFASTYCSETLLSTSLLMAWLREPLLVTQTGWMIASLTAREEETVQYLCAQNHNQPACSFLPAIIESIQHPLQEDQILPLLQTLGNIARHASLVAPLLTQTAPTLIPLLQHMVTTTASRNPILMKVAWLAGCLLVDVGIEHHPSTTVAAPALIPAIINRLDSNGQSTAFMTLEEEREFASALWNALDIPPTVDHQQGPQQNSLWTNQLRPSPVQLPFVLDVPRSTLQTLIRLINSNDSDAVLAAVHVIDLLLRRESDQNLQATLQEEELPDALERVCDSAMESAADVAAGILDDYFYNEDHNNEEAESSPWAITPPPSAGFNFGVLGEAQVANGAGRGRGRGATIPAWMTN